VTGSGGDLIRCKFEVQVNCTEAADTVWLVWANDKARRRTAYHYWDQSEGVELATSEVDFPWWCAEVAVPVGNTVEYKFAIRTADGRMIWEQGENRKTVIPDGETVLSFIFGNETTPAPQVETPRGWLKLLAGVFKHVYACLPALVASYIDVIGEACRRCPWRSPVFLAHVPLAILVIADCLAPAWQRGGMYRVRDGVYARKTIRRVPS
jgi:hypothetical protein